MLESACALVNHHAADAFALMHQIEAFVDLRKRHGVGDHRVDLNFLLHVPIDDLGHIAAPARAAEGRTLPDAPRHQLEGPCADLLAGAGDADDHAHAPAAMAGLQGLAHDRDVSGAIEGAVRTADLVGALLGHVDEVGDEIAAGLLRVDEVGHAEALAPGLLVAVDVDANA